VSDFRELKDYHKVITAQCGEDGIIKEIFARIGIKNKWCVEFGAGDGISLSNTWTLWHDNSWRSVLIECDKTKYGKLLSSIASFEHVIALCEFVTVKGKTSLDLLLAKWNVPTDLDLLSIDIDGNDYYVFEALKKYFPRVIVIEYNATIPWYMNIVQKEGESLGASALAMNNLAVQKGYRLVTCTAANCIFVKGSEFEKLRIKEPQLSDVVPTEPLTHVITSFDGKVFLSKRPYHVLGLERLSFTRFIKNSLKKLCLRERSKHPTYVGHTLLPIDIYGKRDIRFK
jgi:hypothetical protein